jgi:hypothetical protein
MNKEFLKNKIDEIVENYKNKNKSKYIEDLKEFENNSIENQEKLTAYVTERFTKLIWCGYMNTKYKEYVVLNHVYEAMWGTENLSGNKGLLKLINILEKVLDPTNIIIARNMKRKIGKNLFQ